MVPETGVEKARAVMLPIENDRRIPMMKADEMYAAQQRLRMSSMMPGGDLMPVR